MNMTNLPKHPCAGKCTEYQNEQCNNCMIPAVEFGADFAVGDVVVLNLGDDINLLTIEAFTKSEKVMLSGLRNGFFGEKYVLELRHAKPAEIKAKKRLPDPVALFVPDFDDADVVLHLERAIQAQGEVS